MWSLFWRLYSAHLFADFPLQTPAIIRQKNTTRGLFIHIALVFLTATAVIIPLALYRPILWTLPIIITVAHFLVDYLKSLVKNVDAKSSFLLFLIDQIVHLGSILLFVSLFAWGYSYGNPIPYFELSLAIFAIWGGPILIFQIECTIKKVREVGVYNEPFYRFAIIERVLLFLGLSASSLWLLLGGIIIPIIIRSLLIFNEENVPVPIWEWIITIALALGARFALGPIF